MITNNGAKLFIYNIYIHIFIYELIIIIMNYIMCYQESII